MRRFLAITLLIIGVPSALARQEKQGAPDRPVCSLSAAQAPGISALRLGMTAEQVLALFPGSKDDPDVRAGMARPASPFGVTSFIVNPSKSQAKEKYAGVSHITLTLLDGRVTAFTIKYDGPEWPDVDKFVAKVVEGTDFPAADAWEPYAGMETQLKMLTCREFEVRVFAGGKGGNLNYVSMIDLEAGRRLKERKAKAREKESQGAKP